MPAPRKEIYYSDRYHDDKYEYRHVILTPQVLKIYQRTFEDDRLLTETEWRALGVQQSKGWMHYAIHKPEPHVMLFRRPLGYDPNASQKSNTAGA
mmetsp:Transcript_6458/g.11154  ORF Transcript_6458/g.11154 Transcript_6458/m.11154 type:complete len:95 (-) Transcript_6458:445-729(-)|eukprot:CAMPEP_0196657794 /NCGR_PEP_ID=MMETSP1086-20130531/25674_1 /TAXON_ID=77921 /ORGANISM="Cyanoptyche  gloeocystis , Strain SAG4.97" /LENGTH=94 /DNA_ID=CAMNT_0041991077 /DNA_START=77 /DNA_END=361 /DNA_ORIENTATION=-